MLIECLIQREGPTHVSINGVQYRFDKNDLGHSVCDVTSKDHASWLVKFPASYRVYKNPEDEADQGGQPKDQTETKKETEGHEGKRTHRKRVEDHQ